MDKDNGTRRVATIMMFGVVILLSACTKKPIIGSSVSYLGEKDSKLIIDKGTPYRVITPEAKSPEIEENEIQKGKVIYKLKYDKLLAYPAGTDLDIFYLSDKKEIIGYSTNISVSDSSARYAKTVADVFPWARNTKWKVEHLTSGGASKDLVGFVDGYLIKDGYMVRVKGACGYDVEDTDPKTYEKIYRKPRNVSECLLLGVLVYDKSYIERTSVQPMPYKYFEQK